VLAGGPDFETAAAGWVDVAGGRLALPDFLAECARTLGDPAALIAPQRDRFVAAGLAALRRAPDGRVWTALGLQSTPSRFGQLSIELATAGRRLLAGGAVNFFFMQKPPGLRVRFEAPLAAAPVLAAELWSRVDGWRAAGLVLDAVPSVYEPEEHLFGGPASMRYVHGLFTVDSLAWLDCHAGVAGALPAWSFSLYLVRALLDGLDIVGWEDLDFWDRLRRQAYRTLPAPVTGGAAYTAAADGIRAAWADSRGTPAAAVALVERVRAELRAVTADWRAGYFATPAACVGPREAAAFATVFHWNRGGLPPLRQGLLSEALADRRAL
jgi:thiopeptide-type bacteriocin biosynthesis protein